MKSWKDNDNIYIQNDQGRKETIASSHITLTSHFRAEIKNTKLWFFSSERMGQQHHL